MKRKQINMNMKRKQIKRVIDVDVIIFDDGVEIDVNHINTFLNEADIIKDTIGKTGNYTDEYLYFKTIPEKKLEPILLKLDVIRKSPNHEYHNSKVHKVKYYDNYYYWLSDGYFKFCDMFKKA